MSAKRKPKLPPPDPYVHVSALTPLAPIMDQGANAIKAVHVSFADLLRLFDGTVHGQIKDACKLEGVTHVVCVENLMMDASHFGERSALVVGNPPRSFTLETALTAPYFRLGDVPSRFKYPVAYAIVDNS